MTYNYYLPNSWWALLATLFFSLCLWSNSLAQGSILSVVPDANVKFVVQPVDREGCPGETIVFASLAVDSFNLNKKPSYNWQRSIDGINFQTISNPLIYDGFASSTLKINAANEGMDNYYYRVIAYRNSSRDTSDIVKLSVRPFKCNDLTLVCRTIILESSRLYDPLSRTIDEKNSVNDLTFEIPASIPVVEGNAGKFEAVLSYKYNGVWENVYYKGGSDFYHPTTPEEIVKGMQYNYLSSTNGVLPGTKVTANAIKLVVSNGDHHYGTTVVKLRLKVVSDFRIKATRKYSPNRADVSIKVLNKGTKLIIPSEISVTKGSAGNHTKKVKLSIVSGDQIGLVVYKGAGNKYIYDSSHLTGLPGDTVSGDMVLLYIEDGDKNAGTTEVLSILNVVSCPDFDIQHLDHSITTEIIHLVDRNSLKSAIADNVSAEIMLYPTPFKDQVNLLLNFPMDDKMTVSILNSNGVKVYEKELYNGNYSIGEDLTAGIYFVHVESQEGVNVYKIVKY